MIMRVILNKGCVFGRRLFSTGGSKGSKYTPPASQLQTFQKHLENIFEADSRKEAAELLGRLETDDEIYRETLLTLEIDYKEQEKKHKEITAVLDKATNVEGQLETQMTENREIEARGYKAIEHNKTYGIARIVKEVIETADHIKQAIQIVESSDAQSKASQIAQLNRIYAELVKVFGKYEIQEFNPIKEVFDPNEHESIGSVETLDEQLRNRVAEVKRTGFKIKQMLLRSASVVIYK